MYALKDSSEAIISYEGFTVQFISYFAQDLSLRCCILYIIVTATDTAVYSKNGLEF